MTTRKPCSLGFCSLPNFQVNLSRALENENIFSLCLSLARAICQQIAMVDLSTQREEKGFIMKMLTGSYLRQYQQGCYDLIYCRNWMPVLSEGRADILQSSGVLNFILKSLQRKKITVGKQETGLCKLHLCSGEVNMAFQ